MPIRVGRYADRRLVEARGRRCLWQQAILAPQQRTDGQQDYSAGDGRGYIYVSSQPLKVLFTSDSRDESFDMYGAWERGQCTATVAAHIEIGDQDRLTVLDYPVRDSLQLVRGSTTRDEIRQRSVTSILRVHDGTTEYAVGTACQLYTDADGVSFVEWLTGGPSAGTRYSILLMTRPVWVVIGHPMVRGFSGKNKDRLPHKITLKRLDMAVTGGF